MAPLRRIVAGAAVAAMLALACQPETSHSPIPPDTRTPAATQTPLPSPTPHLTPPQPSDAVMVWPTLVQPGSASAVPGDEMTLLGSGGYLQIRGSHYELAHSFSVTFDGQPVGSLGCSVNGCQGAMDIPADASPGPHVIQVEGGSRITLDVAAPRSDSSPPIAGPVSGGPAGVESGLTVVPSLPQSPPPEGLPGSPATKQKELANEATPTPAHTATPSPLPSATPTPSPMATPTPIHTTTPSPTATPTLTATPTPAPTATPAPLPTATPTPASPSPTTSAAPASSNLSTPSLQPPLVIQAVDLKAEVVTITNTGDAPQDMTGWKLISQVGTQVFVFPPGFILDAGATVQITSGPNSRSQSPSVLQWLNADGNPRKQAVWNDNGDPALLYDSAGNLVSSYP
ncbi:MAG: lamin tail domain-containing protein [Chloroflexi bacterium]|nr:lamin tail domain-containing protein [Chloroflexota bacterium]